MTKTELIATLAERNEISKNEAEKQINTVIGLMTESIVKDGKLTIVDFGVFSVKQRAARTGRNPRTNETVEIPASKTLGFKPGKALKTAIN
jgi:nucleoid DNA-binding protein